MIVDTGGRIAIHDEDTAGHAEMQNGGTAIGIDQQVLSAPGNGVDRFSNQVSVDGPRYGPTQAAISNDDALDTRSDDVRLDTAPAGFNFR